MESHQDLRQVLILDKDPATLQILSLSLQQAGFRVLMSSTMEDILEAATNVRPDLILLDALAPDMKGMQLRDQLRQADHTRQIPVLLLVDKVDEERVHSLLGGSFDYITKPFDPGNVVAYVKSFLPDLPPEMDISPLTELPGLRWIERELLLRMIQQRPFALISTDINSLRPFRNVYGSLRADHAIRLLARILGESVKLFGNGDDLVGHVGEDDFYVISTPDRAHALCERIVSKFDDEIRDLYRQEDVVRGFLECEYPLGYAGRYPIMSLSIGVATSDSRGATDPLSARRIANEVRGFAKREAGSAFRFDQRKDDLILEGALGRTGRQNRVWMPSKKMPPVQGERADFAYFVTNQLRVPVTILQSTLDYLLQAGLLNSAAEQRQHLNVLQKHTRYLSDNITHLATLYKTYQSGPQLHLDSVDLAQVLQKVIGMVEDVAGEKGIQVHTRGAEKIGRITVDEDKLCQACLYILYSIVEYAPHGVSIDVEAEETDSLVRLSLILDELCFAKPELAKVFRAFYRPRTSAAPNYGSLGLGFHLARQLLSHMGGTVTLRRRNRVYISLDFPKAWQSVNERARGIQREIAKEREIARGEMEKLEALFTGRDEIPGGLSVVLASMAALSGRMEMGVTRAVCLIDETLERLSKERERTIALDAAFLTFLEALVDLMERRDRYFAGHSRRVAREAFSIGQELKLTESELQTLYYAALLHDLGTVAVPDRIVMKPTPLNDDELLTLRQHPVIGSRAIGTVDVLNSLVQPVLHHHERYDGTGYPLGLKGEKIPLAARILAVVDAYDALTSNRLHRPPLSVDIATESIASGAGTEFDPKVVVAFLKLHAGAGTGRSQN